jgi:hydroxymethylpyrimidine/phosphomethylpyrimidine kinase
MAKMLPVRDDGPLRAGVTRRCRNVPLRALLSTMAIPAIGLTIAGSDSGGGAGIQADLKTFQHFGVFGTSVITAVTAQNTRGVAGWVPVAIEMIDMQIDAVATDLRPAALKTGMLADAVVVERVAAAIRRHALSPLVVDPVMVSASGDALLNPDAVGAIREMLIPLAALVTPNLDEAEILLGDTVRDVDAMERAGRALVACGATAALIKGGHLVGDAAIDILVHGDRVITFTNPRLGTLHTHGTGCTLSAAIAALLARGLGLEAAVERGIEWVHRAIATAPGLGGGHGPVNHWAD